MTAPVRRTWLEATPEDTEALARSFALTAPVSAGRAVIVHLVGDLGAGKTTWARGFLRARGVPQVRSPTYALLETYRLEALTVVHLDLYRLAGAEEAEALGLRDLDAADHLWLIEWPERAVGAIPAPDLDVRIAIEEAGRRITIAGSTPLGTAWLARAVTLV